MTVPGLVQEIWRYPVKSMQGEQLTSADVAERGLTGDRAYALVDVETGKIVSAKNPRKWGTMFACEALFTRPPVPGEPLPSVKITLPDGSKVESSHAGADDILSRALGRQVRLASHAPKGAALEEYWPDIDGLSHRDAVTDEAVAAGAPEGTFFDLAPVHLLTTATLARLAAAYPEGRFEPRRFRPNLLVEVPGEEGFVENGWVGKQLRIGDVRLAVTIPAPRCVMTTLSQDDLPADPGILRAAAQHNKVMIEPAGIAMPSVGVYAFVQQGGVIRKGDPVVLE